MKFTIFGRGAPRYHLRGPGPIKGEISHHKYFTRLKGVCKNKHIFI